MSLGSLCVGLLVDGGEVLQVVMKPMWCSLMDSHRISEDLRVKAHCLSEMVQTLALLASGCFNLGLTCICVSLHRVLLPNGISQTLISLC